MVAEVEKKEKADARPPVGQVQVELGTGAMLSVQMIRQTSPACRAPVMIRAAEADAIRAALETLDVGARP